MELIGIEHILISYQLVKVAVDQASYREKQVHIDELKAMCFLLITYQKRHSFMLKELWDKYNVGRYEYPVTTISSLDLFIRT